MRAYHRKISSIAVVVLILTVALAGTQLAARPAAASVTPTPVQGNPNCVGLGYVYGFKPQPEPPPSGTYTFPDGINTVTITSDGTYFDWTSTLSIDAVIVKGGPNANVYVYSPESYSDTVLNSPINPSNNKPFAISHIEFCYDYEVVVTKDASTTFTRTYTWSIDKSVSPEVHNLFTGDSAPSTYTITVTKTGFVDSNWAVSGSISIYNPAPTSATITGVSDDISGVGAVQPNCNVSFPYNLGSQQTLTCTYSSPLPDGTNRTNTATATTSGSVGGGSGSAAVTFGDPTTEVNAQVNVDDTNNMTWVFADSGSVTYTRYFACDRDQGTLNNTATIRETGQSDSAAVTVNCYQLTVTKAAYTSFTRTWSWTIDKSADQTALTLSVGQQFLVNYSVKVDATSADSNWGVTGNISVHNPAPIAATLNGVSDVISGVGAATVSCNVSFPYVLAADDTLNCTYGASLPDASSRTNTATATLQNTPSGTTDFSGSAAVDFANAAVNKVDECIDVWDDKGDPLNPVKLGSACADEGLPKTFTYSLDVGPYDTCGLYEFKNYASFVTLDTGATGSDSWTVSVNVPCGGCTLTQGYWKTHSVYGPAAHPDDTWYLLDALGPDTPFFLSGKTWYQVFWTPPAGNAYYNLAHQYMAAKLNILNGAASTSAVDSALASATTFFNTYTPSSTLSKTVRQNALAWASTLDKYNNGIIGPGHCDE
jgi:hypothetical protein